MLTLKHTTGGRFETVQTLVTERTHSQDLRILSHIVRKFLKAAFI